MNTTEERDKIDELKQSLRGTARGILDDLFEKEEINILAAPGDSSLCVHAAAAGKSSSSSRLKSPLLIRN